jgi:hypothetical protein
MSASPLLPLGVAGPTAEAEATDAELSRMTELNLPGLTGVTKDGGTWQVSDGILRVTPPLPPS